MRRALNERAKRTGARQPTSILLSPRERALGEALRQARGARSLGGVVRALLLEEETRILESGDADRLRGLLK
jgi:hypothetical protein